MGYPIELNRYEMIRVQDLRHGVTWPSGNLVGKDDSARWEIIGVSGSDEHGTVVLGKVRAGVTVVGETV
jgi:hypothetical protein